MYHVRSHTTINMLQKHGANIDFEGPKGETPLYLEQYLADKNIVKLLIEKGANTELAKILAEIALSNANFLQKKGNKEEKNCCLISKCLIKYNGRSRENLFLRIILHELCHVVFIDRIRGVDGELLKISIPTEEKFLTKDLINWKNMKIK